jgi:protein-S-isoprenylcysteine O-methyltransferase Ste14
LGTWLSTGIFVIFVLLGRTRKEDEMLQREFPEEWAAWAKKVPYKMIPFIF